MQLSNLYEVPHDQGLYKLDYQFHHWMPVCAKRFHQNYSYTDTRTVYNLTKIPTVSDDTGLFVDALNGAPGIYAARYAGKNCSYIDIGN